MSELLNDDFRLFLIEQSLEKADIGTCICSHEGNILHINSSALRFFELDSLNSCQGNGISVNIKKVVPEYAASFDTVVREKKDSRIQISIHLKNQKARHLINDIYFSEGEKSGCAHILFVVRDVTEIKEKDLPDKNFCDSTQGISHDISSSESEISFSNNDIRIRSILDTLDDGYYEVDTDGFFKYVNKAFCVLSGYPYEDLIGKNFRILFDSDTVDSVLETYKEVYKNDKSLRLSDWMGKREKGRKCFVEGSVSLISDSSGKRIGFRGIIRDITKRNEMEHELLRVRKLEAIGILAGGIAHDYNNALTAILGNISLAKMLISPDHKELLDILKDAEEASLKVMNLTQTLSTFSKGGKPIKTPTDLKLIIRDAAERILSDFGGEYELDVAKDLENVEVDEIQIANVLHHILRNACEAMTLNKGKIYIHAQNIKVDKAVSHHEISLQPGNYVMVQVKDEGVGINRKNLYAIFDPYYTTKEYASGMGLAITYAVIKRHAGYIDVASEEGKGAVFSIYLPLGIH